MNRVLALMLALVGCVALSTGTARAECTGQADLGDVAVGCSHSSDDVKALYATSHNDGLRYKIVQVCADGIEDPGGCFNPRTCTERPNGLLYNLYSQPLAGGPWTGIGTVCLNTEDTNDLGIITPDLVNQAFQRLDWPQAPLVIQPPGGETLVNLPTNLYTTLTDPQTQTITLLGTPVTIEATPTTYTWHHGDHTQQTTHQPGRPYPHLDITHTYTHTHTAHPSLDITYRGRYRINNSPWTPIPQTRTIPGTPTTLTIIEAIPQLTSPN